INDALAKTNAADIAEKVQAGQSVELSCADGGATLDPADLTVQPKTPTGFAGLSDRGTQLLLDAGITEALAREGMAREVIRHVQQARKDADLQMEDRIELELHTDSAALKQAIDTHRDYIAAETLVAKWATGPLGAGAYGVDVKVDGQPLRIELRK